MVPILPFFFEHGQLENSVRRQIVVPRVAEHEYRAQITIGRSIDDNVDLN